jgi:plastocyanin
MTTLPLLALLTGAIALAGCGGSKSTSSSESTPAAPATAATTQSTAAAPPAASGELSLAADPEGQLKYDKTALAAKAGSVAIDFTNSASLEHNVTVESSSGTVVGATPTFQGGSKTLKLTLKAGTYKFYCSVPGHRQAGMEGTLVVK